jgi:hypothetical protein
MRRPLARLLPLFLSCCVSAAANDAGREPPPAQFTRPAASQRLVAIFEFDQLEPYDIPRYWDLYRGEGAGSATHRNFPSWNTASLDQAVAYRGEGSVRLSTSGGSVRLRLDPGVIPIFADTDYLVTAHVRTQDLHHARAAVTARYLDQQSRPIPGSEHRSDLMSTSRGEWMAVAVAMPGKSPDPGVGIAPAYIQIDLEVLQPEQYASAGAEPLGPHQVWEQDFSGHAWFDDVAVMQLPRVRLSTSSPVNIIEFPHEPELTFQVRDLAGESLTAHLLVYNAAGRIVASEEFALGAGTVVRRWQPSLDGFGWYRAVLELAASERPVGSTYVDFVWASPRPTIRAGGTDGGAFEVAVDRLPIERLHLLPGLVHHAGAGAVMLPIWSSGLRRDQIPDLIHELAGAVASLQTAATHVSFNLNEVPIQLANAAHLDPGMPTSVFAADVEHWSPFLVPYLERFGQSVERWSMGSGGRAARPSALARVAWPREVSRLRAMLETLVPGPSIAHPWSGDLMLISPSGIDEFLITVPYTLSAAYVPQFVDLWRQEQHTSFVVEAWPFGEVSPEHAAADLVKKTVMLWWARGLSAPATTPLRLICHQPWDWPEEMWRGPMPRVELAVWRTLSERLAGRRIVGRFPAAPGVFCLILAPVHTGGRGALVAWQDAPADDPALTGYFGPGPISIVDMFGNERGMTGDAQSLQRIGISPLPVFIEGVDSSLASFMASFTTQPTVLNPTRREHPLSIVLANPWPNHVQGRITVLEPGGLETDPLNPDRSWRIAPRAVEFAIGPGDTARLPLTVAFSAVAEHGLRDLVGQIELAGTPHPPLRVQTTLELRIEALELDLSYHFVNRSGSLDVVLEAMITNRSGSPATLEITAFAEGHPRSRASISELSDGSSASRRFIFQEGSGGSLKRRSIVVMVHNADTGARITRTIVIE